MLLLGVGLGLGLGSDERVPPFRLGFRIFVQSQLENRLKKSRFSRV